MTPEETILVVDDRPASRYTITHALKRAGFSVMEAATGREALELSARLPAVIVLDVKLPDILGYEVCRRIKANPSTRHILVLQLSAAFLSAESKVHSLESGADAFLTQPVESSVLIATVRSLVRLHQAEARTRLLGAQWQSTFDALAEGVALVDRLGIIRRINHALKAMLGLSYGEMEGIAVTALVQKVFGLTVEWEGEPRPMEAQIGTRYFRFSLSPVMREEKQDGGIFIISETTEEKRAQAAFLINERLAATGRIANTIAHEINNPLEAITNLLYLMNGSLQSPETTEGYLTTAQEQLRRVSRISRQILAFNRETTTPVRVHIDELLDDVMALNNRAVVAKNLQIERIADESVVVEGFPAQLRQVFSNLLRNAVEASEPGRKLRLKVAHCSRWHDVREPAARISFADEGVGIPIENIDRIFEAFFTTKELRGSGIGLWLSNSIIREHRGRIQVRSCTRIPRTGTCISVLLPNAFAQRAGV